jgi:hypothetical protein
MPRNPPKKVRLTSRDHDILAALLRSPLTVEQVLTLSVTFPLQFQTPRRVRRRLHVLVAASFVQRFRYATASEGSSPYYYKATLAGLRLLRGDDAEPPTKGYLKEISVGRHEHTHRLADFIIHTFVAAHGSRIKISDFSPENTVRLDVGDEALFPDCCFRLVDSSGAIFNFVCELDNSTESVRSASALDNWQRKVRLYEAYQDHCASRFRVLVLTTKSQDRLAHILAVAREHARNPSRQLFYGVYLPDYLAAPDALTRSCFMDHDRERVALLPGSAQTEIVPSALLVSSPARLAPAVAPLLNHR